MLSSTLKEYQKNCNANLQAFLDEYEDNTKTFFLQGEIAKYKAYQKSLTDISSKLALYTKEELKRNPISSSVASKLKKLNPKAYDDIVSVILIKMDLEEVDGDFLLPGVVPSLINIDSVKLEHYIRSSILILKFIGEEYTISINHNSYAFALSTFNRLPFINAKSLIPKTEPHKTELPVFKDVFFVHYQCEDFNVSDEITSLSIFADDKVIEFKNKSEAENIEEYCKTVNDLLERGLIPIHWSQNRPYFGVEHIMSRYHKLTGKKIEIEYQDSLNLSGILKHKFGEEYVNHPRLDNLALLNGFNGSSIKEKGLRTFDANRVLLLSKIYFGILNKTLKIGVYNAEETAVVPEQSTNNIEVIEQSSLNDFTRSTIVEYLEDILEDINPGDYSVLVDALYCYFTTSKFPKLERKIIFKRVNKKKVGWALKEVYKNLKTDNLDVEYFRFAQENINLFENEVIVTEGFLQSKFYKAFTTNPAR